MKQKLSGSTAAVTCFLLCFNTAITSCTYDSREDFDPITCDTTDITYSLTVQQILNNNCIACHSTADPAAGLNFETQAGAIVAARDGRLIGSIKHLPGYTPMPQFSPMLPDCQIQKIQKWVDEGAPDN